MLVPARMALPAAYPAMEPKPRCAPNAPAFWSTSSAVGIGPRGAYLAKTRYTKTRAARPVADWRAPDRARREVGGGCPIRGRTRARVDSEAIARTRVDARARRDPL